jgi:hypothetical protein
MRETIEGRMLPVAKERKPINRPKVLALALAYASLLWSVPQLFSAAFAFGTWLGSTL